ncbi:MAG: hypothetical protein LBB88_00825 [Planctomycetaceae bacterium]|jgi:hypothetical protein|nr:hypothetical protein [Planctomycetaceae bacterium]
MNTKKLLSWLTHPADVIRKRVGMASDCNYKFCKGALPVLLVAHIDTVWDSSLRPDQIRTSTLTWQSDYSVVGRGIGADDRVGCYIIEEILTKLDCPVLYCDKEESGGIGAKEFAHDFRNEDNNWLAIIEFDRKGKNDAVFYNCENEYFYEIVVSEYYEEQCGTFSDISIIAPALDIAAVNLSCGYYDQHKPNESVKLWEVEQAIRYGIRLIKKIVRFGQRFDYCGNH